MESKVLVSPKITYNTFKITDFGQISDFSTNCLIDKEISSVKTKINSLRSCPAGSLKAYYVGNRVFVYSSTDKYLYEYVSNKFTKLELCQGMPRLALVIIDGKEEILLAVSGTASILGKKDMQYTMPNFNYSEVYQNRMFGALGQVIYFSGKFNMDTLSMDIDNLGSINIPTQSGEVVAMLTCGDNLYVFCQKAIYVLNISLTEDFTFTKCNLGALKIKAESVAKVGEEIYFISNNKLCKFKNGKIEEQNPLFEKYLANNTLHCTAYNQYYAMALRMFKVGYVYLYNTLTKKAHIIDNLNGDFFGGQYIFDSTNKYLYELSESTETSGEWFSLSMDFGCCNNKKLAQIELYASTSVYMFITSDKGVKRLTLKEGNNQIKLNFMGKMFSFNISPRSNTMLIKNMKIKYRILGD